MRFFNTSGSRAAGRRELEGFRHRRIPSGLRKLDGSRTRGSRRSAVQLGRDRPAARNRRLVAGIEIFEDELPSGIGVTYFVNESEPYVAILQVRRL